MEHFYQNIDGWFSYEYIYKSVVDQADDDSLFVEIGSFKGRSSAFMAVEIANSGKKIKFDCIDPMKPMSHYVDSADKDPEEFKGYNSEDFHSRLEQANGYYNLLQMTSDEAVNQYEDGSIDFIMIDGDHTYEAVKRDIINYFPKMRPGGLMTGDDAFAQDIQRAFNDAITELGVEGNIDGIHFFINIP
jgi:predicted O-methyltransferase YrrM